MAEKSRTEQRLRGQRSNKTRSNAQSTADSQQQKKFMYNLPTAKFMKGLQLLYREKEYFYWFQGNVNLLMQFYSLWSREPYEIWGGNRLTWYQWTEENKDVQMVHAPVAGFITDMFRDLIFSGPVGIKINDKPQLDKRLQAAFAKNENDIQNFLKRVDMMESVGGTVLIKANYSAEISDYPLLEYYEVDKIDYVEKFGRMTSLISVDNFSRGDTDYSLVCEHTRKGISYSLFRDGNRVEMSEAFSPDTQPVGLDFGNNSDGTPKLGPILAVWKTRRLMSKEFYDMRLGASDYEGMLDSFQNCDEIYSRFMNQIRATQPVLFMSEELMGYRKDALGNVHINKPKNLGVTVYEMAGGIANVDGKSIAAMFARDVPDLKGVGELAAAFEWQLRQILSLMFIAPSTGNVDTEKIGSNTTGNSIFKREQSTHLVRKQMIDSWVTAIEGIVRLTCQYFDIIDNKPIGDYSKLSIDVTFPDIDIDDFESRLKQGVQAFTAQLFDIRGAVDHIFKDKMSDTDRDSLVERLEAEKKAELERQESKQQAETDKNDLTKKADAMAKMAKKERVDKE